MRLDSDLISSRSVHQCISCSFLVQTTTEGNKAGVSFTWQADLPVLNGNAMRLLGSIGGKKQEIKHSQFLSDFPCFSCVYSAMISFQRVW